MDDLGSLIRPFINNNNCNPDNLQDIFNILGILHHVCKDKNLTKKFADCKFVFLCSLIYGFEFFSWNPKQLS